MKGQAQAVTAVLITTVVVGGIATSYVWGVPLLEKQQSQAQIDRAQENVEGLYSQVVDVSESGEGTTSRYDLAQGISSEDMQISINESGNYIDVRITAQNSPYPMDTWTLLEGTNTQNVTSGSGAYGRQSSNNPGVVLVRPVGGPDSTVLTYRVEFRNLLTTTSTGQKLSRINIKAEEGTRSAERTTLFISNQGRNWERGNEAVELPSNELVPRENTEIVIGFR